MRAIPAIVLLFILVTNQGLPHLNGHVENVVGTTITIGNQTIGGMGYNSTFYSAGNITTENDSSVTFLNTNIVFEATSKKSSFDINGNLTLIHSSIVTDGSILEFNDTSIHGMFLNMSNSRLNFSGSFDVSHKNVEIMNTSLTHSQGCIPLKTTFTNDTGNITSSSLNVTETSSTSFMGVYELNQNGQPITISGRYEYSGCQMNPFIPFIDSETIKMNYTLGNVTGIIGISTGNSLMGFINRSINFNESSTCINLRLEDNQSSNLGSYPITGKVPVNITIPYGENITIWKSSIVFQSNDSLYLNGSSHNFITFINSSMNMISDNLKSNNLRQYSMNGILDPMKRGIMIEGKSSINFISTAFYSSHSGISPIICSENSSFFIYSEVLQRIRSNLSSVSIPNAEPSEMVDQTSKNTINITTMEGKADNLIHNLQSGFQSYSVALVEFKINNSYESTNISDFILHYNTWSFYFSLNPSDTFAGYSYIENYTTNVSMLSLTIHSHDDNSSLEISVALYDLYEISNNITMNLSFKMANYSSYYTFKEVELIPDTTTWNNHTFTFPIAQNSTLGLITWSIQYNNTLNVEEREGSQNITIPGEMHEFSLNAINMTMTKGWIAYADGELFHSSTRIMDIFLQVNNAQIYIPNQRMYFPDIHNIEAKQDSLTNITFSKIVANVSVEISGYSVTNNTFMTIANSIYGLNKYQINIPIPMGNYSISIYSENSQIYAGNVFINEKNQSIVISVHEKKVTHYSPITILGEIYPFIVGGAVIAGIGIFVRLRYLRICPLCLSEIGFIHRRHRCPYKKS